jgi:hypothetical protein
VLVNERRLRSWARRWYKRHMQEPNTPEKTKALLGLCRAGRLYDVQKWIEAGKSNEIASARNKKTLLQVAVDIGFHSLVELISKHEGSQASRDAALADAVSIRRFDVVQLLLTNGADIKSVPLIDVLLTWDPTIIRFFIDHGADTIKDSPFAAAFGARIRTALRPFLEHKQAHPELAGELQKQADRALRHFCREGDLKWVSLLMWAGADARSLGPTLRDEYADDPECYTSGLREACYAGKIEVLKKLKQNGTAMTWLNCFTVLPFLDARIHSTTCRKLAPTRTTRPTVGHQHSRLLCGT